MELPVNVSLNDCHATNIRDWPSNARLPPSSSSYMPRYRLTSIGEEKLSPRSRETDTNVASGPGSTNEFQETAKVPSGETATEGAEALDTSGGEAAVRDGHVTPPSWEAPTVTDAHDPIPHDPLLGVRKTTVTLSCNAATLGVVAVAPEETATGGLQVLPSSVDLTTSTVPEALTTPTYTLPVTLSVAIDANPQESLNDTTGSQESPWSTDRKTATSPVARFGSAMYATPPFPTAMPGRPTSHVVSLKPEHKSTGTGYPKVRPPSSERRILKSAGGEL